MYICALSSVFFRRDPCSTEAPLGETPSERGPSELARRRISPREDGQGCILKASSSPEIYPQLLSLASLQGAFGSLRHPQTPRVPPSSLHDLPGSPGQGAPLPLQRSPPFWGIAAFPPKRRRSPEREGGSLADVASQLAPLRKWDPWGLGCRGGPTTPRESGL